MPSLSAQNPQFDNWDFDQIAIPTTCGGGQGYFPTLEACNIDVEWWMWKEFDDNPSDEHMAGLYNNPQGCNQFKALFFVEAVPDNNSLPLFATRNPVFGVQNYPAKILLSLQERPELGDQGTFAEHLKIFGTNEKSINVLGASATELGVSRVISPNSNCNFLEIWLDASANEFEFLGFALSDATSATKFSAPAYMDNVEIERLFPYEYSVGCSGLCLDLSPPLTVGGNTPADWVLEVYLNDNLVYDHPSNTSLPDLCFDYDDFAASYVNGVNEFRIELSSDDQTFVNVVREEFDYSTLHDIILPPGTHIWTQSNVPNNGMMNSLTLSDGANLIITSDVSLTFMQDGKLEIQPGGLVRNHGELSSCYDFWQGVRVVGDEALGQVPLSNQGQYYGYQNSVIENAKIGVMNSSSSTANRGGFIKTFKSIFRNNEISARMWGKGNASQVPSTIKDKSAFRYSTFLIDDEMSSSLEFRSFIELYFINMSEYYSIQHNHFLIDQSVANPPVPNFGISSFISTFQAKDNEFNRLHTGLSTYGSSYFGSQAYIAHSNDFEDCLYGIHNRYTSNGDMRYNDFVLGNVPTSYHDPNPSVQSAQVGIIMESRIANFYMEYNNFETKGGNHNYTIGSQCTNMGTNYYEIRENDYDGLTVGNVAHLRNGKSEKLGFTGTGLTYLCNKNTSNGNADFFVSDFYNSIINPKQEYESKNPVFNSFSYSSGIEWDFGNLGNSQANLNVEYYYDPSIANNTPRDGFIAGITKEIRIDENHCKVEKGPIKGYEFKNRQDYFSAHSKYLLALSELNQAILQQDTVLAETKRDESSLHKKAADEAAFNGYLYAVLDTTGTESDSIPLWLGRMERMEADLALSGWYRQKGQSGVAKVILDGLQQKYALSGELAQELDVYRKVLDVVEQDDVLNLSNTTLNQLRLLTVDDGSLSSAFAKNLLSMYGDYYPPILVDLAYNSNTSFKDEGATDGPKMHISPNPTDAYTTFDWSNLGLNDTPIKIELRDKMGMLLQIIEVVGGQYRQEVSLETYQSGVIYYRLIANDQEIDRGQIILSK